tara:strand:- start:7955 stop:8464 length:510 start_codon:yes stop_codon:yes gene_type:complete
MEYSFGGSTTDVNKRAFSQTNLQNTTKEKREGKKAQKKAAGVGEAFLKNVPISVAQGAYQGSKAAGPAGAIVGGAIGLVTGLMGMSDEVTANQASFQAMLDSQKAAKQREKLATAAEREAIRASKRKDSDVAIPLQTGPIVEADRDIVSSMESGASLYDRRISDLYGYT